MNSTKKTSQKLYDAWMKFAETLGLINGTIILTIVYWTMIVPMGLILKTIGYDPLQKKIEKQKTTYYTSTKTDNPVATLERPF